MLNQEWPDSEVDEIRSTPTTGDVRLFGALILMVVVILSIYVWIIFS